VFRNLLRGSPDRQLHVGSDLSIHPAPGSSILSARRRKRALAVRIRHFPDLLDPSRLRRYSVQLLRMAWKLNRGSDIECLLPGTTECRQRHIEIGHADRRRYCRQRAEGILAGPAAQIQQKVAKPTDRWRKEMRFLLPYDK